MNDALSKIRTRGTLTPLQGADLAKQAGIRVFTVALGTNHGTLGLGVLGGGAFPGLFQGSGRFTVRPDPVTLAAIARDTGGLTCRATTASAIDDPRSRYVMPVFGTTPKTFTPTGFSATMTWSLETRTSKDLPTRVWGTGSTITSPRRWHATRSTAKAGAASASMYWGHWWWRSRLPTEPSGSR